MAGEYVPVAKSAAKSVTLGFGNVAADNTNSVMADARGTIPATDTLHDASHYGSTDYFGNPIMVGATETINGTANYALQTTGNSSRPETHTRKYGRVSGVTAINGITGAVTYETLQGSGYGMCVPITGVPTDKEVDAAADPYNVPARMTYLGGMAPTVTSYNPIG